MNRSAPRRSLPCLFLSILSFAFAASGCNGDSDDGGSVFPTAGRGETCGGLLGTQCEVQLYCDIEDLSCGVADQTGVCKERPEVCAEVYAPVCGCDGRTYGNGCEAAGSGVSLSALSACKS